MLLKRKSKRNRIKDINLALAKADIAAIHAIWKVNKKYSKM